MVLLHIPTFVVTSTAVCTACNLPQETDRTEYIEFQETDRCQGHAGLNPDCSCPRCWLNGDTGSVRALPLQVGAQFTGFPQTLQHVCWV